MGEYKFREIEKKWQAKWKEDHTYKVIEDPSKPKYYILDMFPYPSGAGLHVGHPLGYIASDIVSRFKTLEGYNVLHPMGFDSFGLPAEQYAIQTGQHPAVTTEQNLARYKEQLGNLGFSYDWDKEIRTSDPSYYKWTQWIFIQLFNSWYNKKSDKAEAIDTLIAEFEKNGNENIEAVCDEDVEIFTASSWNAWSEKEQREVLMKYRITYLSETMVNWCPELGTVLANDEVKDGVSERGGYPVERKSMNQWSMRITAYADRLLKGLDNLDWSDSLKEIQKNWIGKSYGCSLRFQVENKDLELEVFTTRPDTSYGVTFVSIAPEHELINELTTQEQKTAVDEYVEKAKNRSERDRMSDTKTISGVFTGTYVINPFNGKKVPLWIADYVLAGYGTGVVMAVPSSDTRDFAFASHFEIPVIPVQEGPKTDITKEDFDAKAGTMINSGPLDGLKVPDAIKKSISLAEEGGFGSAKINYKMRDAIFSRQRYWGEPIPIYYKDGTPYTLDESKLPLELPEVDEYLPTETGEPPLGRAKNWQTEDGYPLELNTMPGWAGSSWYFYRYMDANNDKAFVDPEKEKFWKNVDLYLGGAEHATGHLLYSRFWNMFLFDRGFVSEQDVFKKLVNQGMILGESQTFFIYPSLKIAIDNNCETFLGTGIANAGIEFNDDIIKQLKDHHSERIERRARVEFVNRGNLDIEAFINSDSGSDLKDYKFVSGGTKFDCIPVIEKMSKRWGNVVNPDDIVEEFGADTMRMYEMFLGPLEQMKPWSTKGIDGTAKFLRKLWRLFYDDNGNYIVTDVTPTDDNLKTLHKTLKKTKEDIERLSINTCVSGFMICVNELTSQNCHAKAVLEPLIIAVSPFAPHIAEELWSALGHDESITKATYPEVDESKIVEAAHEYPISINGKMRTKISFPLDMANDAIEKAVLADEMVIKWTEGKPPRKVIIVPKKIVNVVV